MCMCVHVMCQSTWGQGCSEDMVRNFIDLDIFSICKRNGFDNEALTQIAEKSAELID